MKEKRIEGISDLNDESNRHGMRVVVELKKEANPQVVLNNLYRYTQLQDTVGVILLALDNGVPKIMTLKTMLQRYVEFQDQVIRRRTQFDLKKARERAHILEGLKRAVDIVDEVIYAIRHCGGGQAEAKVAIMEQFGFDDVQADAICKFPLGRLAGLEIKENRERIERPERQNRRLDRHPERRQPGAGHREERADRPEGEVRRRPPHRDCPCVRRGGH